MVGLDWLETFPRAISNVSYHPKKIPMKKLLAKHEAKLAEIDAGLARIEMLEKQIAEHEIFGEEESHDAEAVA